MTATPTGLETTTSDRSAVRRLTHRQGPNFSVGFRFLPPAKRRAVYAAYSVCRVADDIVDEVEPGMPMDAARAQLDAWEDEICATYEGRPGHPVTRALADVLDRYPIPRAAFSGLVEGCRWDLVKGRYEDFPELERYCELVAVTISDISLAIFGVEDPAAPTRGRSLAMALQLTNICRDVGEDILRDRVYLPADEMQRFGVAVEDLFRRRGGAAFEELMRFQVQRAREYYRHANPLPDMVAADSRLAVRLMGIIYARILDAIGRRPQDVLHGRVRLGALGRALVVAAGVARRPFVP